MHDRADITYRWAWALLDGLAAAGVRRVAFSPGSRSTPLALAALRHPGLTVHVGVDERATAFLALGLAKAEAQPVALMATSGSAIANWMPAVTEADMGRVPLLLLSADRPPELQDCGANQTMDQVGLFGRHVRAFHALPPAERDTAWLYRLAGRSVALSRAPLAGPVHWNIPLREPLLPDPIPPCAASGSAAQDLPATLQPDRAAIDKLDAVVAGGSGVIVCGPYDGDGDARALIIDCARRLGVPVFADILSGLRCGMECESLVLRHPDRVARDAPAPSWVMRFGGTPVSRALNDWLARCREATHIVVSDHPRVADPDALARYVLRADPAAVCRALSGPAAPAAWLRRFIDADTAAQRSAESVCADEIPFEGSLLRAALHALPAHTPVFLGNSLAVRAADWFAGVIRAPLRLFGNRGVSGIDGNIATASGIATALGPTVAAVGDLAFLHDLNALALARDCPLTVLVLDNGGGGIFDHLPQASLPEFERGWLTPQSLDPALAARAFGLPCTRAESVPAAVRAIGASLSASRGGVVHVPIAREHSRARIRAFHGAPPLCKD